MNLVPGATPTQFQNALTDTPGRSLRTYVNGQNPNSNNTKSDGATNVNLWLPHHAMYVAPAETIDTVNISTSNFDAEQGMAGGAAITVITKSGTNEFRGSAFEFFNTDALNARPYFATRKTPIDRNIFGGTLGGPIQKNSLFFFGSYEGFFDRSTTQIFYDVPTAAMRNGDFSGALSRPAAAADLRSADRQRRRHRPLAVRRQRDPGEPHQPGGAGDPAATTRCRTCRATRATTCATPTARSTATTTTSS